MSLIKSKLGLSNRGPNGTALDSRDQYSLNRVSRNFPLHQRTRLFLTHDIPFLFVQSSLGEKIVVQKSTTSYMDYDVELGHHDGGLAADRGSTYSLTSEEGESSSNIMYAKPPVSPATAAAQGWMRPSSGFHGPYDTTSELVTAVPGANGRRVLIATPTPALAPAVGRNGRPTSNGSSIRSLKGEMFTGR